MDENETVTTIPPVEFPRGRFPGKLDDKGRLKLPADFQKFFNGLAETKLFLTSLDRSIAQLYPIAEWRKNELFFENLCLSSHEYICHFLFRLHPMDGF